jgi:hypothetical protein
MTPSGIDPANFWFVAQCLNRKSLRIPFFWDATLRSWMSGSRIFETKLWLHLQSSKRREVIYQRMCHIPESENLIGSAVET